MARNPNMKSIAEKLGVSINAVSIAINNKPGVSPELRRKVMQMAEDIGYFDQKPRYRPMLHQRTLCILMQSVYFTASTFYTEIVLGIQERASQLGYNTTIELFNSEKGARLPENIVDQKTSAVLVLGAVPDSILDQLAEMEMPAILVDHVSFNHDYDSVMTGNMDGAYEMTDYLLSKGYRKIGFFGDMDFSVSIKERYMGVVHRLYDEYHVRTYAEIMAELDLSSILYHIEEHVIHGERDQIWTAFNNVKERPEVFICSNDDAAAQLLLTLNDHGVKVPEDIAITGFDDSNISARMIPALTTMRIDKQALGREAVERLLKRMDDRTAIVTRTSLRAKLIIREST